MISPKIIIPTPLSQQNTTKTKLLQQTIQTTALREFPTNILILNLFLKANNFKTFNKVCFGSRNARCATSVENKTNRRM